MAIYIDEDRSSAADGAPLISSSGTQDFYISTRWNSETDPSPRPQHLLLTTGTDSPIFRLDGAAGDVVRIFNLGSLVAAHSATAIEVADPGLVLKVYNATLIQGDIRAGNGLYFFNALGDGRELDQGSGVLLGDILVRDDPASAVDVEIRNFGAVNSIDVEGSGGRVWIRNMGTVNGWIDIDGGIRTILTGRDAPTGDLFGGIINGEVSLGDGSDYVNLGRLVVRGGSVALGGGDDIFYGNADALYVFGEAGADRLAGNAGADHLVGGAGNDIISGDRGRDVLEGDEGQDRFLFNVELRPGNADTLLDFDSADDRIELDDARFEGLVPGALDGDALYVQGGAGGPFDAEDRIIYLRDGRLFFDADGSGAGRAVQFALLEGRPDVAAADFFVI